MGEIWLTRYSWCTRRSWKSPTGMSFWAAGRMIEPARVVVNHSTETVGFPGYGNGASAPHFTIDLLSGIVQQHIPLDWGSRCLAVSTGGVTDRTVNITGTIQIEVIGAVTPGYPKTFGHYDLPNKFPNDRVAQRHLARLWEAIWEATGKRIPMQVADVTWVPYPASYGVRARQRLSSAAFRSARGILGHQHAPANSHGDGVYGRVANGRAVDIEKVLAMVRESVSPPRVRAPKGSEWEVTAEALNCRSGPGTEYSVIGVGRKGTRVFATGKVSGAWIEAQTAWQRDAGMRAWWHSGFLAKVVEQMPPKPDPDTQAVQRLAIRFGIDVGSSGADGFYGPDTRVAVAEYTASYGYPGDPMDVRALRAHMEAMMATVLDELRAIRESQARIEKLMDRRLGFSYDWWIRQGFVPDPSHRAFPADPGSPADKLLRLEAAVGDGSALVYTAEEGPVKVWLNPETDRFEIPEEDSHVEEHQ